MEERMIFENEKISRLYRKVLTTAKCKHNASARIKNHQIFSQWTLALISSILIITPLIESAHKSSSIESYADYFGAIQVGFAVLVLISSLLVGALDFSLRSERFHRCGIELDKLCYRILNEDEDHKYYDLYARYIAVLEKYENHKTIDHLEAKRSISNVYYNSSTEGKNSKRLLYIRDTLKYLYLIIWEYLPYKFVPIISIITALMIYIAHQST